MIKARLPCHKHSYLLFGNYSILFYHISTYYKYTNLSNKYILNYTNIIGDDTSTRNTKEMIVFVNKDYLSLHCLLTDLAICLGKTKYIALLIIGVVIKRIG